MATMRGKAPRPRRAHKVTREDAELALHYADAYIQVARRWIKTQQLARRSGGPGQTGDSTLDPTASDEVVYLARFTKNCPPPIAVKRKK